MNNILNKQIGMSNRLFELSGFSTNGNINLVLSARHKKCQFFAILNINNLNFDLNILDKEDNILHTFNITDTNNIFNFKNLDSNSFKLKIDSLNKDIYIIKYNSNTDYKDWQLDIIEENIELFNTDKKYFGFLFSDVIYHLNDIETYLAQLSNNNQYKINIINSNTSIMHIYSLNGPELN